MLQQFDPTLELDWTDLKFPKWNSALESRLVEGCEAQAAGRAVREIEAKRNAVLVDMMKVFKKHKIGAGLVLERELKARKKKPLFFWWTPPSRRAIACSMV